MNMQSISVLDTSKNIDKLRKLAKAKDYSMRKVRDKNCYNLQDAQSGQIVMKNSSPMEIHHFLCNSDD